MIKKYVLVLGSAVLITGCSSQLTVRTENTVAPQPSQVQSEANTSKIVTFNKNPDTNYSSFEIRPSQGWDVENQANTLKITQSNYQIVISQKILEKLTCEFDDSKTESDSESNSVLKVKNKYKSLDANFGLRRFTGTNFRGPKDSIAFEFCGVENDSDSFVMPTKVGDIVYYAPQKYSESKLAEMDGMLETLELRHD